MTTANATVTLLQGDVVGNLDATLSELEKSNPAVHQAWLAEVVEMTKKVATGDMPESQKSIPGTIVSVILAPLFKDLKIDATYGTETITSVSDFVIVYIDPDYAQLTKDRPAKPTQAKKVGVMELIQNAAFETMYGSLGTNLAWESEADVINFCRRHRDKLQKNGCANFFRMEVDGESFVACVYVLERELVAYVSCFDDPDTWDADYRHRVVLPQLQ